MKFSNYLKPLHFDSEHSINYVGYLLLALGMLGFGLSIYSSMQTLKKMAVTNEEISHIQSLNISAKPIRLDGDNPEAQAVIEKITKQVRYPWDSFFSTLEAIHTSQVSLMAIQPNFEKKEVLITAEAEDVHQMLAYISIFERQNNIDHVELLSQELITDNQQGRLSFTIMAELL